MAPLKCTHQVLGQPQIIGKKCGPYRPVGAFRLGIYADPACFTNPEQFEVLKNQLGFSFLQIYPSQWHAVRESNTWNSDEILLSIQDLCDVFRDVLAGTRDVQIAWEIFNQRWGEIRNIISEMGEYPYGLVLNEPTTLCGPFIEDIISRIRNDIPVNVSGTPHIIMNLYQDYDWGRANADGIIVDEWANWEAEWKQASNARGRRIEVSGYINMSDQGHRRNLGKMFSVAAETFARRGNPTVWLYASDICTEILECIVSVVRMRNADGQLVRPYHWLTPQNREGWNLEQIQRDLSLAEIHLEACRGIPIPAGCRCTIEDGDELLTILASRDSLEAFMLACLSEVPPEHPFTGSICGCGHSRELMCSIMCRRIHQFVQAASEAGWLQRDCINIRRIFSTTWHCQKRPCSCIWDPTNQEEMRWWRSGETTSYTVEDPILQGMVMEPSVDACPVTGVSSDSTVSRAGMEVFQRRGFIFNELPPIDKI